MPTIAIPSKDKFNETLGYFTAGYAVDTRNILESRKSSAEGIVLFKKIPFYSLCEHHLLPFYGEVSIAYLPAGKIVGAGRIALLVEALSRRLQVQERLTKEIADAIEKTLKPKGIAVLVDAKQFCTVVANGRATEMQTTEFRGAYDKNTALRKEFLISVAGGMKGK